MPFQAHEATLYVPLELNRWLANLDHLLCNLIGLRNNEKGGRAKEKETSWFVEIINFWSVAAISRMEENLTRVDTTATCSLKRRVRLWASLCAPCFRNATKIRSLSLSLLSRPCSLQSRSVTTRAPHRLIGLRRRQRRRLPPFKEMRWMAERGVDGCTRGIKVNIHRPINQTHLLLLLLCVPRWNEQPGTTNKLATNQISIPRRSRNFHSRWQRVLMTRVFFFFFFFFVGFWWFPTGGAGIGWRGFGILVYSCCTTEGIPPFSRRKSLTIAGHVGSSVRNRRLAIKSTGCFPPTCPADRSGTRSDLLASTIRLRNHTEGRSYKTKQKRKRGGVYYLVDRCRIFGCNFLIFASRHCEYIHSIPIDHRPTAEMMSSCFREYLFLFFFLSFFRMAPWVIMFSLFLSWSLLHALINKAAMTKALKCGYLLRYKRKLFPFTFLYYLRRNSTLLEPPSNATTIAFKKTLSGGRRRRIGLAQSVSSSFYVRDDGWWSSPNKPPINPSVPYLLARKHSLTFATNARV